MSPVAKDALTSVLINSQNEDNSHKAIRKIIMRAVGQRDMSIQEEMHQLLSLKLVSLTFQVISSSLDGSRKVSLSENDTLDTEKSLLDLYAKRNMFEADYPGISKCNFVQFASNYFKAKLGTAKRTNPVVLKTFPNYSSNTKGPNYGLLCRYLLLKYKPWCNVLDDAWCNEKASDSVYINQWHFVPNWSQQINSISEYVLQLVNNDDYIESDTGEREEWMIIADIKLQSDNGNKLSLNCPSDFYAQDRLKYTAQEIGDMPHWINMQKKRRQLEKGNNSNAG